MPRVKKNPDVLSEKKLEKKLSSVKKTIKKKIESQRAKTVVVDVIEDEDDDDANFFPELPKFKAGDMEGLGEKVAEEEINIKSSEANLDATADKDNKDDKIDNIDKVDKVDNELNEIDQQKKFYSELVTEIKEEKPEAFPESSCKLSKNKEDRPPVRKSVNLYRKLVWRFVAFTVILLVVVFYFSFSKATVIITPKGEAINDSLLLKVQPDGTMPENPETDFREKVEGTVTELTVSEEKTFEATGEEFIGDEIYGQVTVINNSAKSQALVATTRILSPDNKLFRLKEGITVPAGGEVKTDVYVEKPSEDMAIKATKFTIPGLWLGLQDKIYAESSDDFVYRQKIKRFIKASDIEKATKEMNDLLLAKAKLSQQANSVNEGVLYDSSGQASFAVDAKAGEAKEQFSIKAQVDLVIVTFSKDQAAKLAAAKLALLVPDDKELSNFSADKLTYIFDNYDSKTGIAAIKANFGGVMVLKNNTEIIDKKQLVNLNREQLENYLKTFPEIESYEVSFFPSFINRAPRLPERIQVEVKGLNSN